MSLTSSRVIGPGIVLSFAALTIVSCQQSPTAPSAVPAMTSPAQPAVTEYFVTLFDETPAPEDPPPSGVRAPAPAPAPAFAPGSAPAPWPPGPPPIAAPGVPVPTPPSTHFRVRLKVDPEPVLHSGKPVGIFSCRDLKYTWYYTQIIHGETGVPVTLTERENFFDGRFVSKSTETIQLAGNGTAVLHTRWCSGYAKPHYAQSRFKGKDENGETVTISGPWVRLLTP